MYWKEALVRMDSGTEVHAILENQFGTKQKQLTFKHILNPNVNGVHLGIAVKNAINADKRFSGKK
jgi:hypothetical protein